MEAAAMALMPQLPAPRAVSLLDARSSSSASFLSSSAHVGGDRCSFFSLLGGYRQCASPRSHFRRAQGNELIFSQRFSGYGAARSDSGRAQETEFTSRRSFDRSRQDDRQDSRQDRREDSRQDGDRVSRIDSGRRDLNHEFSSGGRQGGQAGPQPGSRRTEGSQFSGSRRTEGNQFGSQRVSVGRQSEYNTRWDSPRSTGGNEFNNSQRSSGGRQDDHAASHSDSRRNQGSNFNSQRSFGDGQNGNASTRSDSRRGEGNEFNSQRNSRTGNDGGRYAARDGSRGAGGGQGRFRASARNSSSKTPSSFAPTITPRESASQFASDRAIYRAPWDQGPSSSSSSSSRQRGILEQDDIKKNPLLERLKKMQEEVDADDAEDAEDDDDGDEFLGPTVDRGFRNFEEEDGGRKQSAMSRIVERLSQIPGSNNIYRRPRGRGEPGLLDETDSPMGPRYGQPMFPGVGREWSTPDNPVPTPAAPRAQKFRPDTRFPWERNEAGGEGLAEEKLTRVRPPSLAELTVPDDELKRLRSLGLLTRHRIKVGKLGVTNGIVESIHNEWRNSEIVRVKCEGLPAQNMKRTHDALEERTGGLVIWRAGGACLVYRGKDYVPPALRDVLDLSAPSTPSSATELEENKAEDDAGAEGGDTDKNEESDREETVQPRVIIPRVSSIYDPELEKEMEEILSSLGPRYDDWTGMNPVPVDADLLIGPAHKFKRPFRQLPYGVKPSLSNLELTNLRRLGRPIPPHFVLGVNKGLDGLASAIAKLWEKSEIAKIAVKRGVQNTNHERMAEQLKRLTGGVLLSRDKFFIVLYRGKDFLPPSVAAVLEERQAMTAALQEEEEKARLLPQIRVGSDTSVERSIAGTLTETLEAKANWEKLQNSDEQQKLMEEARKAARSDIARRIERKVSITLAKKHRAELELQKVEKRLRPAGPPEDREHITEEERHMFSKLGLKMHAFLLLGRRGVFGGTVENMHLHWKHRPLVKVIYKAKDKVDLEQTARMLEYESGGILVSTVPTNKGQAIMVYRGKNYQRPPELRPRTLLTKRQALKRSIEMQRQKALTKHLMDLEKEIENMQADLSKLGLDKEDDEGSLEPTTRELEDMEEEIEESTISNPESPRNLESPKEVGEDTHADKSVGHTRNQRDPDVIYRADPLSRREKLILRQQALKEKKRAAHFNVGHSNALAGLARAIRIHFRKHALVKVGVKGRAKGTPVEEILFGLEEATGGTLVSQENSKIILYRGWPEGQARPTEETRHWEKLPPELRSAMIAEVEADDDYLHESDWEESDDEEEDDEMGADEENEAQATLNDLELNEDSDWEMFDESDYEDEEKQEQEEGSIQNELELGLGKDDDGDDEEEDDEMGADEENEAQSTLDDL